MHISPPITVLAIMAAMVAGTAWLTPPQDKAVQVTLMLPTATHQKLTLWGKEHAGTHGQPLTVVQVIEALLSKREKDHQVHRNSGGTARNKNAI